MRKTLYALLVFAVAVLIFTRLDYVVNVTLYQYQLKFDWAWYLEYIALYALLYQFTILVLVGWTKNFWLFCALESFVLSCTQDFVFFFVWDASLPVGDWTWMPQYSLFGTWTTIHQVALSTIGLGLMAVLLLAPLRITTIQRKDF